MVELADMGSELISKVSTAGRDYGWLTGSAAFYVSVTNKWAVQGSRGPQDPSYPFSKQGLSDFISQMFGKNVATSLGLPTGGADRTLNLSAIVNKEAGLALAIYFLKEIWPNKYTRALAHVAIPPLAGWAVGRVFDDEPHSGRVENGAYSALPAHVYGGGSNTGRALSAGGSGAPWTS